MTEYILTPLEEEIVDAQIDLNCYHVTYNEYELVELERAIFALEVYVAFGYVVNPNNTEV